MKVAEIVKLLENECPRGLAEDWDNSGLLVGDSSADVERVYIALDATSAVIEDAIEHGADMLITHHPLIFKGVKEVTDSEFVGRRVMNLIRNNIAFFCMHTNFDAAKMSEIVRKKLSLPEGIVLLPSKEDPEKGIGMTCHLPDEMTLEGFSMKVKDALSLDHIRVFGDLSMKVSIVSFLPGSGKSDIDTAIAQGADCYITGDIDHHSGLDAVEKGIGVIDAGHYGMERFFIEYVSLFLKGNTGSLEIITAPAKAPYHEL